MNHVPVSDFQCDLNHALSHYPHLVVFYTKTFHNELFSKSDSNIVVSRFDIYWAFPEIFFQNSPRSSYWDFSRDSCCHFSMNSCSFFYAFLLAVAVQLGGSIRNSFRRLILQGIILDSSEISTEIFREFSWKSTRICRFFLLILP